MKKILIIILFIISVLLPDYQALAQDGRKPREEWKYQRKWKMHEPLRPREKWKTQEERKAKNGWRGEKYPYGDYYPGPREGRYGARKTVRTEGEARKMLHKYFSPQKATVGKITEKDWFFEAEIKDRNNRPVDRVIIDKRTGRIRSIY